MVAIATRTRIRRGLVPVVALLAVVGASSCTSDGEAAAPVTTAGTPPTTAYVVPDIPAGSIPEICAGAGQVVEADDQIGSLLAPLLGADSSDEADKALLAALGQVKPFVEAAGAGYDRMAVVLPEGLAADARTVRDATASFYTEVGAVTTMDDLIGVLEKAAQAPDDTRVSAARLDAATRKVCNLSLYNKSDAGS
jgi:hypothetical protein